MTRRVPRAWRPDPPPLRWPATSVLRPLLLAWVVALILTVEVPWLHDGDRHWWPWCCITGVALGGLGYAYVRRGRGNAAGA